MVLQMLSIGLRLNNVPLVLFNKEPWLTLPTTVVHPCNNDLVLAHELQRTTSQKGLEH
jgi:hypothetical protein